MTDHNCDNYAILGFMHIHLHTRQFPPAFRRLTFYRKYIFFHVHLKERVVFTISRRSYHQNMTKHPTSQRANKRNFHSECTRIKVIYSCVSANCRVIVVVMLPNLSWLQERVAEDYFEGFATFLRPINFL